MILLLEDESTIALDNEDAKISEFFQNILEEITPEYLLSIFLKKKLFNMFKRTLNLEELIYLGKFDSMHDSEKLKKFIDNWTLQNLENVQKEMKPKKEKEPPLFPNLSNCFHEIFDESAHKLSFVKDDWSLKKIVDFLRIPKTQKSRNMFNDLSKFARLEIKPDFQNWQIYEDYINQCTPDNLLKLSEFSSVLAIEPLIQLVAWRLSWYLKTLPEDEIRKMFQIPADFRNASLEMVEQFEPSSNVKSWMIS